MNAQMLSGIVVSISVKNSKLGKVHSVSLLPVVSCPANAPCIKACYARRCLRHTSCREAWTRNWEAFKASADDFFNQIHNHIQKHKPALFRWHIGGDIPSLDYLVWMIAIARANPGTKFLAFTKNMEAFSYWNEHNAKPANLVIRFSNWLDYRMEGSTVSEFIPTGHEVPADSLICQGDCTVCGHKCWDASYGKVALLQH